jgi:hypothetical protein
LRIKGNTPHNLFMVISEAYVDTVGSTAAPAWPRSYDTAITKPCTNCGAAPFELCTYSPARTRRLPCISRLS